MSNFGRRSFEHPIRPAVPEAANAREGLMQQLKRIEDPELSEMLTTWANIRAFQESGNGVSQDERQIATLFGHINERLATLNRPKVHKISDLP